MSFSKTTAQPADGLMVLELKIITALKARGSTIGNVQLMQNGLNTVPTNLDMPALSYPDPESLVTIRRWSVWDTDLKTWL